MLYYRVSEVLNTRMQQWFMLFMIYRLKMLYRKCLQFLVAMDYLVICVFLWLGEMTSGWRKFGPLMIRLMVGRNRTHPSRIALWKKWQTLVLWFL